MVKIRRLFKSLGWGFFIFVIFANIYFAFSNIPLLTSVSRQSADTKFPLYHAGSTYDYNVYLSVITLGKSGYWLNRDAFTSEKTKPGVFYFYYILVGKMAKIFNLWQPYAYHLARIVSVELFIVSLFLLCRKLSDKYLGFWAAVLALVGTRAPAVFFGEKGAFINYTPWWAYMDGLKRIDGLPHHIFGQMLMLVSLFWIFSYFENKKTKYLLLSSVSVMLTGFFLPPALLPIIVGIPLAFILRIIGTFYISHRSGCFLVFLTSGKPGGPRLKDQPTPHVSHSVRKTDENLQFVRRYKRFLFFLFTQKSVFGIGIILLSSLIPLGLSFWQMKQGFPWNEWTKWEINRWNFNPNFDRGVFFSMGILPILAIPAVVKAFRTMNFLKIFLVLWAILPIILLPFVNFLSFGKTRLFDMVPFIPFGLLAGESILTILKGNKVIYWGLIIIFFVSTIPLSLVQIKNDIEVKRHEQIYTNIFIPNKIWQTLDFINKNEVPDSVVLSNEFVGNIIPAYTPTISYFGHIDQTMNFSEKQINVANFLTQKYSDSQAMDFVKKNRISYVYFGVDERLDRREKLTYSFLKRVFQADDIIIYNVKL